MSVHGEPRPSQARPDSQPDAQPDAAAVTVEEVEDRWRRALAELDNQRKRHTRELRQERETERARAARVWLPVVDNLDLALEHVEADPTPLAEGVRAIRDQAVQILRDLGYPRDEEAGVPFDPARHEVVAVVDAPDAAPGTVLGVVRPGYGGPERQLRPAAVTVSRSQG
ncbi:nucleotide exchange factor GrpE [Kitasatospora sp. NPDC052896]|uniref:nucleotide exchange factor GrpE n=1 Tax=Kitasatospora sp. NPDC052896 TaxID=3364061 RepID=UPI0037C68957